VVLEHTSKAILDHNQWFTDHHMEFEETAPTLSLSDILEQGDVRLPGDVLNIFVNANNY